MSRVVSLYLPYWPIERLERISGAEHETPLVLGGHDGRRRVVTAVNGLGRRAGLRPGLAVAQAQAMVPGLTICPADPAGDKEGLYQLALWALRYTPLAAPDPPSGLVLDVTGAAHLWGGEMELLTDIRAQLAASGITALAALAGSHGAAHALARFAATSMLVANAGSDESLLLPLPVAALRLPPAMAAALSQLGLRRISDLATAPRAALARRFGPELHWRLDQVFGCLAEPVAAVHPPEVQQVQRDFAEPLTAPTSLANHIAHMMTELCAMLAAKAQGARRLDLLFHRVDGAVLAQRLGTAAPRQDAPRLARLLRERLEQIDPGFGIERMVLRASWVEPYEARQTASLETSPEPDLTALIDTLASRIGGARLYRLAPVESDVPERSQRRIPPLASPERKIWPAWPRPARLLSRPERINTMALLPDHPPVSFTWRGVRRHVARADGPERIFGEWWKRDAELAAVRDYFRVEDEAGGRYWIFRAGDGEDSRTGSQDWFVHGLFA